VLVVVGICDPIGHLDVCSVCSNRNSFSELNMRCIDDIDVVAYFSTIHTDRTAIHAVNDPAWLSDETQHGLQAVALQSVASCGVHFAPVTQRGRRSTSMLSCRVYSGVTPIRVCTRLMSRRVPRMAVLIDCVSYSPVCCQMSDSASRSATDSNRPSAAPRLI